MRMSVSEQCSGGVHSKWWNQQQGESDTFAYLAVAVIALNNSSSSFSDPSVAALYEGITLPTHLTDDMLYCANSGSVHTW
jgi:hypothetical protein